MNQGCSSEKTSTSSSTTDTNKIPRHVVNLKESNTHLFYVIQSDNESHGDTQQLVQLRISKQRPPSRKSFAQKMQLRYNDNNDGLDENRGKLKKTQIASIHKRTDHPSFVVLPEVFSKGRLNIRQTIEKNQSTSENSNATYVIRSKNDNRTCESKAKIPRLFNSLRERNPKTAYLHGMNNLVANKKTDDFCECATKATAKKFRDSLNLDDKIETVGTAQNASKCFLRKEDLFNIDYVDPTQNHIPQRLRAGQDYDKRYKSCFMCPNMTRIFPPTNSRRRTRFTSNCGSDSSPTDHGGYTKINFKLVRQCLISGSVDEKTEVLDAIRMRIKSSNSSVAINTIEEIVKFDLFGVQCECRSKPLLGDLFWPLTPSHQLQTSIAQFVNALVSYKVGRNYFNNRPIIGMLTWGDIGRDNIDQIMGDNLMGIMMKLSLNRFQRTDMIKNGLISWLMQHMEGEEYSASKYHLQCMAGLLRNLLQGFNLENFSSSEMQKMIVLLGRFLEHENEIAKRYVCDSLMILFQNINCVTSAKNLNFQRVIQEHATNATDAAQKERLGVICRLLNRSATTTPHINQKFYSRSEEEPFLDADLGPCGEVDHYSGEFLIREKFTGDGDTQRQNDTAETDKSNSITSDDSHKHDQLITRVFIEHLNCFLPNIENNRIFPLCNSRCADKIRTCSHVGDIQPRKRQPYIPPNSRLSLQKHSMTDSIQATSSVGYNKSALQSKPADKGSLSTKERIASRVSTISHDKTAAKWNHIGSEGSDDKLSGSVSAHGGAMEKIFEGHSKRPHGRMEGEEIISNSSHRPYSFETVGVSDERTRNEGNTIDDQRQGRESPHTANVTNEDRNEPSRTKTKDREGSKYNAVTAAPMKALEATTLPIHTKEAEDRKDLLRKKTSETEADASVGSHGCTPKNSVGKKETCEFAQQKFGSDETNVVDQEDGRQSSHSTLFDVSDDFRQSRGRDSEQKTVFEGTTLKEPSATRGIEKDDSSTKSEEKFIDLRKDNENSYRTQVTENIDENEVDNNFPIQTEEMIVETGQQSLLDARSERVQKKTSKDKAKTDGGETGIRLEVRSEEGYHRTEDTENKKEVGPQLSIRSEEVIVKRKTVEKSLLDARSERALKKISKDNLQMDGNTGVKLKVRSEENIRDLKNCGNKFQESNVTNEKSGLTLQAKSELFATGNENQKLKSLRLDNENLIKDTETQGIRATETGIKLNVRSDTVVQRGKYERLHKLSSASIKDRKATQKLHARSMEMIKDSKDHILRKSKSDVMYDVDKCHTEVGIRPRTPPGSQPTTTAKRQNVFGRAHNARSVEHEGTNYQLFKSSSEELLGSTKNQNYSLEPTGNSNWSSRTRLLDQFAVRSKEIVGRTQSAIMNGKEDSRGTYQSSKHCVDCTGSGYVLRARPSQPCDRCKVSLTRYPDFVDALANQDYHRRDVTRTNDEWIKTDLINKTDGKLNSKPNQGNLNKDKLGDTKIDENLKEAKWNADRDVGKSSATQEERSTQNLDKKANQNSVWAEDGDTTSKKDWLAKNTSSEKEMELNTAQKATDSSKDNEDESVTDALFLSGEIRRHGSVRSIHRQSDDCTEITSNTKPQPVLECWQSDNVINKNVLGEKSQANLIFDPAASMMSSDGPSMSESSKQMDEKDELTGNNQHAVDDASKSGSRDSEIEMVFHKKELKKLDETPTSQETQVLTSDDTENGGGHVEVDFDRQDSVQLNIAQPILGTADRLKAISDIKNYIPRSETTVDDEVVSKTTEQRENIIPNSVTFLKESTDVTNLMATTNERAAVGRDDPNLSTVFSHSIGKTISFPFLSSEATVMDDRELNLSSSLVNTSNNKTLREAVSDPQLSERQLDLPVARHLFPRSSETIGVMRSKSIDVNVKGTSASGESENTPRDLKGGKNDAQISSFKENAELSDKGTEKIDLKNQLSSSHNIKWNDCSDNISVAMNKRQQNKNSLNVTSLAIRSVEAVNGSPDNPPSELRQNVGNDIASPCSGDLIPIRNEQRIGKESIEISVTKSVDNKSSVILDEAFTSERNLHSDKQTVNVETVDDTEIDQELNLEGDGNIERGRHKIKVVNSTCCRRLLNNDELINRLSEKVLEKLTNKIHRCGTNCKSPCGGLNSLFNTKNDNNLNWQ
ncbi:uncharacterized protein LOC119083142 [Bradysia coprophila]|uniref:uncharacterized protein LOC119083142 n=1 Tax=Bradysia coprophila TaxID=38358 RepID=UPI00187DCFBA|nr:uncharacterized protein LOC119083142 [Bradysia coprophila]